LWVAPFYSSTTAKPEAQRSLNLGLILQIYGRVANLGVSQSIAYDVEAVSDELIGD
jgi:hypothetical protein